MNFSSASSYELGWLLSRISYSPSARFKGIAAKEGDKILGVVGMDHWTPNAVQVHVAADHPKCLAPIWQEVVGYAKKHGRRLIYAVTPSDNEPSLRLQVGLGFTEAHRIKDAWSDGVDMVIMEYAICEQGQSGPA